MKFILAYIKSLENLFNSDNTVLQNTGLKCNQFSTHEVLAMALSSTLDPLSITFQLVVRCPLHPGDCSRPVSPCRVACQITYAALSSKEVPPITLLAIGCRLFALIVYVHRITHLSHIHRLPVGRYTLPSGAIDCARFTLIVRGAAKRWRN